MGGRREPGQRLAEEHGQRVVDCLYDVLEFVEMAANLTGLPEMMSTRSGEYGL